MRLLSVFVLGGFCALALADSFTSDSGIQGPTYPQQLVKMNTLKANHPDLVEIVDYGESVKGRTLRLMLVKRPGHREDRPTLYMSGSTHGNEYLNIEDRLPEEILNRADTEGPVRDFLDRGGVYVFVPILNPDGYATRRRENDNGVDLNRDWDVAPANFKGFKEKETRLLSKALETLRAKYDLQYKITVDYHCCIGAVLHPWSYENAPPMSDEDNENHKKVGEMATKHLGVEAGTTGKILGYYPLGTTKDYFFDRYHALAFTYEGKYKKEKEYLPKHVAWWEDMTRWALGQEESPMLAILKGKKRPFISIAD